MRILIISAEVWRDDTNGGNVLSNIFSGIDAEYAQIYCNPGIPSNKLCKKYYQMTDSMVINNIFKKKPIGKVLDFNDFPQDGERYEFVEKENKKFYNFFRKHSFEIFHVLKEVIWKISKWENSNLRKFIIEFNPDIIFAPCYGSHIMLSIDRYVANLTKVPVVSYISDDHYSLKHFRPSPVYWINRLILRRNLRKTFPYYNLTYTMTDEQLKECQNAFNCNIKILRKGIDISEIPQKRIINKPIKIIYAGGIYCGRWKTLSAIAKALQEINKHEIRMILDIYTGNELSIKQEEILNDGINSFVHNVIPQKLLKEKYSESDIALHVESFDLRYKLLTRISFSTKIVDCLTSGCAVMAISWDQHSGYRYLEKEDAAILISNKNDISSDLLYILENQYILTEYADKAYQLSRRNHQKHNIHKMLYQDFDEIIKIHNCNNKIRFEKKYEDT